MTVCFSKYSKQLVLPSSCIDKLLILGRVEEWLLKSQIIDELFGVSMHQDLVAKSDIILGYTC